MSVVTMTGGKRTTVTPAGVRRRPRGQQLRGPVARPQQRVEAPVGRPTQPLAPALANPVRLRHASPVARSRQAGIQLTQRGLAVVLGLFLVLALTSVVVIAAQFFGVSNAPLTADEQGLPVAAALQGAPTR